MYRAYKGRVIVAPDKIEVCGRVGSDLLVVKQDNRVVGHAVGLVIGNAELLKSHKGVIRGYFSDWSGVKNGIEIYHDKATGLWRVKNTGETVHNARYCYVISDGRAYIVR